MLLQFVSNFKYMPLKIDSVLSECMYSDPRGMYK